MNAKCKFFSYGIYFVILNFVLFGGYVCFAQNPSFYLDNVTPTSVKVGENITISGGTFTEDISVSIGNISATIVSKTTSQIVVTVPKELSLENNDPTFVATVRVFKNGIGNAADTTNTFLVQVRNFDTERIAFWGNKSSALPIPFSNISDIVEVSLGKKHNIVLRKDGTINVWGNITIALDTASDTGDNFDNLTSINTPTFNIGCPTNDDVVNKIIEFFDASNNHQKIGTSTCANGTTTITTPALDTGIHKIIAKYTYSNNTSDSVSTLINIIVPGTEDQWVDRDKNGLIDIYYIEDLDTVRYSLDGKYYGNKKKTKGCPGGNCYGYELKRNLDFTITKHYKAKTIPNRYKANTPCGSDTLCGWIPIGTNKYGQLIDKTYSATFEGNYNTIRNFIIRSGTTGISIPGNSYIGLFGSVKKGIMRNVSIEDAEIHVSLNANDYEEAYVGTLAGKADSSHIAYCNVKQGNISSSIKGNGNLYGMRLGGIVGYFNNDTITHSFFSGYINGREGLSSSCGGIVGFLESAVVFRSYALGKIDFEMTGLSPQYTVQAENTAVGGVVGICSGSSLIQSFMGGTIRRDGNSSALPGRYGGLIGETRNNNTIIQCSSLGLLTTVSQVEISTAGGLIGANKSGTTTVIGSFNTKKLISNCNVKDKNVGGIAGFIAEGFLSVKESYSAAPLLASRINNNGYLGGILSERSSSFAADKLFWNSDAMFLDYVDENGNSSVSSQSISKQDFGNISDTIRYGLPIDSIRLGCSDYYSKSICTMGPGFEYTNRLLPKIQLGARVRINGILFIANNKNATNLTIASEVTNVINSTGSLTRATAVIEGVSFTADSTKITNIQAPYKISNLENGLGIVLEDLPTILDFNNRDSDYQELDESGFSISKSTKVPIAAKTNIVSIAAGGNGSIALKNDGILYAWGDTTHKQTVLPADITRSSIISLARGESHSLVLTSQGKVIAWGDNTYGQSTVPSTATSHIVKIAAGRYHSLALSKNGKIISWGKSTSGQLPDTSVSGIRAIAAGENFSAAIDTAGEVYTWGSIQNTSRGKNGFYKAIYAGYSHFITMDTIQYIKSVGNNSFKQLDFPDAISDASTPYVATGGNRNFVLYSRRYQYLSFKDILQKTYGDAPFVLNASTNSGLPLSYSASNTLASINNNTVIINGAGTVEITAFNTGNGAYLETSATRILTINKANQSISFESLANKTYGDVPFVLQATSSANLTVLFSASNTLVAINNNTVTINGTGTVNITAYHTGNNNYLSASAIQIFSISNANNGNKPTPTPTKPTPTLTFTALPNLTIEQKYTLVATSNSPVEITFVSSDEKIATVSGNTLTAVGTGTASIIANQAENPQFNSVSVQQILTVTNKVEPTPALTFVEIPNTSIRIFPNPANDYITIQYDKTQKIASAKVYDIMGYGVMGMEYIGKDGIPINIKSLPKGEYIIIVYGEKGEVLKAEKVIKE
ncbi:MAG: T9SS type A sorting domain-containing protein [Chitinophagaceae bacterium]|nr:T9SS type A sorting domain-containing protein [Chitinophagaceae bacterium]